ncbi:MAG: signal peptide peptidase SppA [Marinilabiliales bacterium]
MFFVSMLIIGGIIASATSEKMTHVKKNSILEIRLDYPITERTSLNPFQNLDPMTLQSKQALGLNDILKNLEKAKTDDKIKGVYLNLTSINAGIATIEEIRNALISFKEESGKFIIAHSDMYSQASYYLASVADKIYLTPHGFLDFRGLNGEVMFFTKTLEKLGIEPQIIRGKNNKFKSAVEPFMYTEMSEANKEQTLTYLGSIWNHILKGIGEKRNISVDQLKEYADSLKIQDSEDALNYKFVDALKYKDEVLEELVEMTEAKSVEKLNLISMLKYKNAPKKKDKDHKFTKDKIAVIYATGQINAGKGDEQTIGGESLSKTIREARIDSNIKAIVFRVNSPGGDALASEVIWREVELAKKVKPVIVSMGDYAASGGYYISCPADVIVSNPVTLTGSIGVFGVLWNAQEFLNSKLGIYVDGVKTNPYADLGSPYRPLNAQEKIFMQNNVDNVYDIFKVHVAEGRNLDVNFVDSIGQGRVWSGINAKEIGLVDELGGLVDAIEIAKEKAGLENFRLVQLPEQENPFEAMINEMLGNTEEDMLKENLGQTYKYYKNLKDVFLIRGVQARLPYFIDIY